jgi:hypothetical protein
VPDGGLHDLVAVRSGRDVVATVPMDLWADWLDEGDLPGDEKTGEEWGFYTGGAVPDVLPGSRVYVVAHGRLRGFSPLTRLVVDGGRVVFCRRAGAVAVTIPESIRGFRGWRYRWWNREDERAFPDWKDPGAGAPVPRWQHDETGRICEQEQSPGPRWYQIESYSGPVASPKPDGDVGERTERRP